MNRSHAKRWLAVLCTALGLALALGDLAPAAGLAASTSVPQPFMGAALWVNQVVPPQTGRTPAPARSHRRTRLLNAAGAHLPVGGFFGAETASAVSRFQSRHRLPPSGVLGAATWRALLHLRPREPAWAGSPPTCER